MRAKEMTQQVRLAHWSGVMKTRSESGESVRQWCRENGIKEKTYYYLQRKLREVACERIGKYSLSQETAISATQFAEVKLIEPQKPSCKESELCIEIGTIKLTASSNYPPENVAEIIKRLSC